jgi:hypothetical protein
MRRFKLNKRTFKCPECKRYLSLTTSGVWACFYAESHEGNVVLYEEVKR